MSGKYAKKKSHKRAKNRRNRRGLWILIGVLCAALVGLAVMAVTMNRDEPDPVLPGTTNPPATNPAVQTQPTEQVQQTVQTEPLDQPAEPVTEYLHDLGGGIVITDLISYTGAFMEDRTDEVVSGVLAIRVTNNGEESVQTMDILLSDGETEAEFSLSTLFPGDTVIVLEKNRMAYSDAQEFTDAETSFVALFGERPGMYQDQLEIQCLNGAINVTNISGADIEGDILIYYKNYVSGIYYGGITYRIRIQGGLKAGEIRQGTAAHFNPDNSAVVFVVCE